MRVPWCSVENRELIAQQSRVHTVKVLRVHNDPNEDRYCLVSLGFWLFCDLQSGQLSLTGSLSGAAMFVRMHVIQCFILESLVV